MEALLAHCTAAFSQHGGLFAVFFLGGLMGGFTHCLAMCGPMVAGQSACAGGCRKPAQNASQFTYHLGRLTTYGALGFAAALFARQIAAWPFWPLLSSAMLVLAGLMFLASSLPASQPRSLCSVSARSNYLRGTLMGFMPCGLIYAALMMAATLANPLAGMLAMWLFTLGTVPALLLASGSAALLSRKWQQTTQTIGRAMMAVNGVTLLVMAAGIIK
ncbi:MAG: sulfite exporter TauE/SafE family protein [Alphaproteobacteria bacterium]|nr:sulfite exporter TauE/SafE family protein [Alphaproteobacteria bacterium]